MAGFHSSMKYLFVYKNIRGKETTSIEYGTDTELHFRQFLFDQYGYYFRPIIIVMCENSDTLASIELSGYILSYLTYLLY